MKVTISVGGKFHAFHLAKQLEARGYLDTIFTSHPSFIAKESGLPREKIQSLILKEIIERALAKIPYLNEKLEIPYHAANFFDKQVAQRITPCDILVGWSGFSLYTLRKIRRISSAKIILEHGSTHLDAQRLKFLDEEKRLGTKINVLPSNFIRKELSEYEEADFIAVPSQLAKDSFLNKGIPAQKIILTPLGVDIESFRPILKNDRIFRIISVGISVRKGTHYLLKTIDALKIKELELWLIGKVEDDIKPFLKKYSGIFKYIGRVPHRQLYKYYSQGSVSVLFSLDDGFGLALLEAMACGLPVICSDQTGAKDVVREGVDGFIVPTRDTKTLKEKIIYLYENPEACQKMGTYARENVAHKFTWNHYGERIINTYLNLFK
jgi:glycosyltransferase involved in cell wall biosynthesis